MNRINLKYIAGLVLFVAGFSLSVLLVNALSVKDTLPVGIDKTLIEQPQDFSSDSLMQRQMLRFLEQDRQHGRELSIDLVRNKSENQLIGEEIATANLVEKMRRADYKDFPMDFQAAWRNHVRAWQKRADFLRRADQSKKHTFVDQDLASAHARQSQEIHETYMALLKSAEMHGVKFSY